jgi:lipid-binding SYLF domain-containing protein
LRNIAQTELASITPAGKYTRPETKELNKSGDWELGTGPSIVIVDTGMAKSFSTATLQKDVYAFFFNQKRLMAGLGLQGSKITRITPPRR